MLQEFAFMSWHSLGWNCTVIHALMQFERANGGALFVLIFGSIFAFSMHDA